MAEHELTTAAFLWGDRHLPPQVVADRARQMAVGGAVDYLSHSSQLGGLIPHQLWRADNAPMAALIADPDVMQDAFLTAAYCHAAAPSLGISLLTDTVRSGPAQLSQMMWTLAHMTEGRTVFHFGVGELTQLRSFDRARRPQGGRAEDLLEIFRRFSTDSGPFGHKGRDWTLEAAWWLGDARPFRPRVHALGVGPTLLDHAISFADGLSTAMPCALTSPEECAENIAAVRDQLERKGRDPDTFRFGMFCPVLIHEDENVLDAALDNPIVRWIAATFGQVRREDWARAGLDSPTPEGWTNHTTFIPDGSDDALVEAVLATATRTHAETGYLSGTPGQVAARLSAYVEAGISFVSLADYLPVIGDPADAHRAASRSVECLTALKSATRHEFTGAQPSLDAPGHYARR